jgi:site-specific DNA-cytosine methylase
MKQEHKRHYFSGHSISLEDIRSLDYCIIFTEDIFKVNLEQYVKGRNVDLMWASPDCTSHSKASGIAKHEDKQ